MTLFRDIMKRIALESFRSLFSLLPILSLILGVVLGSQNVNAAQGLPAEQTTVSTLVGWIWTRESGRWVALSDSGAPSGGEQGFDDLAVTVSDNEIFVWGSFKETVAGSERYTATGGIYHRGRSTWSGVSNENAPEGRTGAMTARLGNTFFVWGGRTVRDGQVVPINTGALYDLETSRWTAVASSNAPHFGWSRSIWSGKKLLVWGAREETPTSAVLQGAVWDGDSNTWHSVDMRSAPDLRFMNVFVPQGPELFAWGAQSSLGCISSGGYYDIHGNQWRGMLPTNAPESCREYLSFSAGSKLLVWGGQVATFDRSTKETVWSWVNTGGLFDFATNTWSPMATDLAPRFSDEANLTHGWSALWTGENLLLWKRHDLGERCDWEGVSYNPDSNSWRHLVKLEHSSTDCAGKQLAVYPWLDQAGDPPTFIGFITEINPQRGALCSCRRLPELERTAAEYRGDQVHWLGDRVLVLSNRLPKSRS